nr:Haem peroxidase domain containing protein [Haemonchus contortus]
MVMYEITASTQTGCPIEIIKIPVSVGDPAFDVNGTVSGIPFTRAKYDKTTGKGFDCPREQKIIYYDFLPVLINEDVKPYEGYKPHVPPGVSHSFSTVASRFAYTIVPPAMILRKKAEACEFREKVGDFPSVRLCQNWWNAQDVIQEYSVDEFILGMVSQVSEDEDIVIVEDLRDFFYGPLHFSRLDAVAATIMQGRDNGLSSYNTLRKRYNLVEKEWHRINPKLYETNKDLFDKLAALYGGDIGQLDAFVGAMLEVDGEPGELLKAIMKEQFERVRDSDREFLSVVSYGPDKPHGQ